MVILGCERGWKYRPQKKELARKVTGTKKWECPFKLRGKSLKNGDEWTLNVVCGSHNHELADTLVGDAYVGCLSVQERSLVEDMTKSLVKPRNILIKLKEYNKDNRTTIKQVYNARQKIRITRRGPRTEM